MAEIIHPSTAFKRDFIDKKIMEIPELYQKLGNKRNMIDVMMGKVRSSEITEQFDKKLSEILATPVGYWRGLWLAYYSPANVLSRTRSKYNIDVAKVSEEKQKLIDFATLLRKEIISTTRKRKMSRAEVAILTGYSKEVISNLYKGELLNIETLVNMSVSLGLVLITGSKAV